MNNSKKYQLDSRLADLRYDAEVVLFKTLKKFPDKSFDYKSPDGKDVTVKISGPGEFTISDSNGNMTKSFEIMSVEKLIGLTIKAEKELEDSFIFL